MKLGIKSDEPPVDINHCLDQIAKHLGRHCAEFPKVIFSATTFTISPPDRTLTLRYLYHDAGHRSSTTPYHPNPRQSRLSSQPFATIVCDPRTPLRGAHSGESDHLVRSKPIGHSAQIDYLSR